ncbi:hypothetical protein PRIPAC_74668 [Pristionchus pacificus]|uniref:Branched-chain-amino-acid aminotransferase n=1 Tax=Pristionchus pacificus TaxID=54126 RepID=A0A454XVZ4_PRIPA|nr:hypothetical protein PRIPAC_74668 [Pristionchus pacificus]|eukprot:PDM64420.1 hypothetical protein PRIPAC_52676 [Pristionchus pacificus]
MSGCRRLLQLQQKRHASSDYGQFHVKNLKFVRTPAPKPIPTETPAFGTVSTDHMLEIDYKNGAWQTPVIRPVEDLRLHPLSKVLHYCPTIFEGLKAFRGVDNEIRMFRTERNMARMVTSAKRAALPDFCPLQLEHMIEDLVRKDQEWIPSGEGTSLYIRPLLMGVDPSLGVTRSTEAKLLVICCPVGPYYASGWKPIKLYANPAHIRAAPGGVGAFKMGCNYAPTIDVTDGAAQYGAQQCLWLWGDKQRITETGTSNLFLFWKNSNDDVELITPPTSGGLILPGVTRESILTLAKEWGEFLVTERYPTMKEVKEAAAEGRILEFFGAGTAAVVAPCEQIVYVENPNEPPVLIDIPERKDGKPLYRRLYETITGIQNGKIDRPEWVRIVN